MKISLLLNSREKGRQNLGNIFEWTNAVRTSVSSLANVEIIIKYDIDDDESYPVIRDLHSQNPDILIKTLHSERVGYGGLHIGCQQCFERIEPDSVIVYPMPDDIFFVPNSKWDAPILEHAAKYSDGIFLVKMAPLNSFTDAILFSRGLIEKVGFGPKFGVDQWGHKLCQLFMRLGIQDRVLCSPDNARRRGCKLDHLGGCPEADERWLGPRQDMLDHLGTPEFATTMRNVELIIKNYLKM